VVRQKKYGDEHRRSGVRKILLFNLKESQGLHYRHAAG